MNYFGSGDDENYVLDNPTRYTFSSWGNDRDLEKLVALIPGPVELAAEAYGDQQIYLENDESVELIYVASRGEASEKGNLGKYQSEKLLCG